MTDETAVTGETAMTGQAVQAGQAAEAGRTLTATFVCLILMVLAAAGSAVWETRRSAIR